MHLIQVADSDHLHFHNSDVQTVFSVTRSIYRKNYQIIKNIYQLQDIDSEIGLVIGAITESQKFIQYALEQKGGKLNMCKALEELEQECINKGMQEGLQKGILSFIQACNEIGISQETIFKKLLESFDLNPDEARAFMQKCE